VADPGTTTTTHGRLRNALAGTSAVPLLVLVALAGVQNFDLVAFGVLAPDIRHTFHISSGAITAIAGLTAAVPIVFAVVLGYVADRYHRVRLTTVAAVFWGLTALLSGLAPMLAVLIVARLLGGVGLLSAETVYPSLLADYYPPRTLGSVFGSYRTGGQALALLGGPLAGGIAAIAGWRTSFVLLALPTFVFAFVAALVLREPARGAAQGVDLTTEAEGSILEGYRRVRAIASLRRTWMAAFLFGGGTIPFVTILSNFFKDVYHSGDTTRGLLTGLYGVGGLIGIVVGGWLSQRAMSNARPDRLPLINGLMIIEFAVGVLLMGVAPVFGLAVAAATVLSIGGYGFLPAYTTIVATVAPPRIRAQAYAWSLFYYALGGIIVSAIVGAINNAHGPRPALVVLACVCFLGGAVTIGVRRTIVADAARAVAVAAAPDSDSLLSCRGLDAGYDGVQVLFGVDLDVRPGEMLALLGTNGAGKSTVLKAITGLVDPIGGQITFDGRDITQADPGTCARLGIMAVPGGRGIFPTLTVMDNLKAACWQIRRDRNTSRASIEHALDQFPVLRQRAHTLAGDLSGGEQQMLSLAQAFIAKPKLLLIDELSLGLAPVIVSQLVGILREIHAAGTTVVLVEQSVNIALELAERAIFMEKGEVRFSGETKELLERPDVLRAVFLKAPAAQTQSRRRAVADIGEISLSVAGMHKSYGGVIAVNDVSFDVHRDEILGLIGPNGAGKTTLFDLISGFAGADRGTVRLDGADISDASAARRHLLGLGRSFQDARLWPGLTVAETLAVALHREGDIGAVFPSMLGIPRVADSERLIHERVDELIEQMNLQAFRNKFIAELSTGTRRIVELGCIVGHRPRVLLLDEPSSGIAQREAEALGPLLKNIREQLGCSMLIIEHDMQLISSVADRMLGLDLGQIIATGTPAEVLAHPRVVASYLGTGDDADTVSSKSASGRAWQSGSGATMAARVGLSESQKATLLRMDRS
jgi:ABC-type branched-subunit amino acid transport system ATPase component/predicted MFS family arabinose efflux permease